MTKNYIFFNHSFEKKRLKALISWIHKTFGEKEALRVVDELKATGFINATRAGLSIGLHDLITPPEKPLLISKAQVAMNKTDQDFKGGKITATERSQRIIDTWHRTSDTLRKQVVDHFNTYDQLNSVYIMALSGARGNFSQVRQLIGMRGLMADPQGQIISFPIRSNFREGLTLTEYFISCSGARKGLVDTALRTADTGYLTRRLVDVSHQVVIKRVACNTSRGIVLKALQTGPVGGSNKTMLPLKDRLIGRVLAEDIKIPNLIFEDSIRCSGLQSKDLEFEPESPRNSTAPLTKSTRSISLSRLLGQGGSRGEHPQKREDFTGTTFRQLSADRPNSRLLSEAEHARVTRESSPNSSSANSSGARVRVTEGVKSTNSKEVRTSTPFSKLAARDSEISPNLAFKIACLRDRVIVRSSLTCACTHEVCQLCYGWSLSQGKLVSLGEAVGVIAAQSIGEPGTQLTMRTFHTGGVFSGDLLQDIRAPHAGKVFFPQALQGLLVRTAQGQIAFLIKTAGALLLDDGKSQVTRIQLEAATMVFVRQGEVIESNAIIGELAVMTKEGNQPIKSRQTLFAEFGGRVTHHRSQTLKIHKPEADDEPLSKIIQWYDGEDLDLAKDAEEGIDRLKNGFRFIEPTHSLSLGVFWILATRVGAKESHLSKLQFNGPKLRLSKLRTRAKPAKRSLRERYGAVELQQSNTSGQALVAPGTEPSLFRRIPLALRSRAKVKGGRTKVSAKSKILAALQYRALVRFSKKGKKPTAPLTKWQTFSPLQGQPEPPKRSAYWSSHFRFDKVSERYGAVRSHDSLPFASNFRVLSFAEQAKVWPVNQKFKLSLRESLAFSAQSHALNQLVLDDLTTKDCFVTVQGESTSLSVPLANRDVGRQKFVEPSRALSRRPDLGEGFLDKKRSRSELERNSRTLVGGRNFCEAKVSDASEVDTFTTPLYVLNTIAEEGDLVDENYKECTSLFQFTGNSSFANFRSLSRAQLR